MLARVHQRPCFQGASAGFISRGLVTRLSFVNEGCSLGHLEYGPILVSQLAMHRDRYGIGRVGDECPFRVEAVPVKLHFRGVGGGIGHNMPSLMIFFDCTILTNSD